MHTYPIPLTNITLYIVHLASWNVRNLWNAVSWFWLGGVVGCVCAPRDDRQIGANIWSCVLCLSKSLWSNYAFWRDSFFPKYMCTFVHQLFFQTLWSNFTHMLKSFALNILHSMWGVPDCSCPLHVCSSCMKNKFVPRYLLCVAFRVKGVVMSTISQQSTHCTLPFAYHALIILRIDFAIQCILHTC